MKPVKIEWRVKRTAERGRWKGKEIDERQIAWEIERDGKKERYATRKQALDAMN